MRPILLAALLCLVAGGAMADPPPHAQGHKDKGDKGKGNKPEQAEQADGRGFSAAQRGEIETWFAGHPGVVAASDLPPGIAKNLARGKPLPPGIAKKQLPPDLRTRIVVGSYEPMLIGRDVVLLDPVTSLVVDVLRNVLR